MVHEKLRNLKEEPKGIETTLKSSVTSTTQCSMPYPFPVYPSFVSACLSVAFVSSTGINIFLLSNWPPTSCMAQIQSTFTWSSIWNNSQNTSVWLSMGPLPFLALNHFILGNTAIQSVTWSSLWRQGRVTQEKSSNRIPWLEVERINSQRKGELHWTDNNADLKHHGWES